MVEVECERLEGKFAGRDEISEQLQEALDNANIGIVDGIGADGTTSYEVVDWQVTEEEVEKPKRKGRKLSSLSAAERRDVVMLP